MGCVNSSTQCNSNIQKHFTPGAVIGRGGFACIRTTTYGPEKLLLASKEINLTKVLERSNGLDSLKNELATLQAVCPHQYITNIHFSYTDRVTCFLVLDLCSGGDLRFHIGNAFNFQEKHAAFIATCIGSALHHAHTCGVIHRDVKPENIILDGMGIPKLTDFGVAYYCQNKRDIVCSSSSGTMRYLAPEVLTTSHKHSFEVDFWSLGTVLVELLTLQRAFKKHCPREMVAFSTTEYFFLWESLQRRHALHDMDHERVAEGLEPLGGGFDQYGVDVEEWRSYGENSKARNNATFLTAAELVKDYQLSTPLSESAGDHSIDKGRVSKIEPSQSSSQEQPLASYFIAAPKYTAYGAILSEACRDLIQQLLDVRITHRLGVGKVNYERFTEHPFFKENGVPYSEVNGTDRPQEVLSRGVSITRSTSCLSSSQLHSVSESFCSSHVPSASFAASRTTPESTQMTSGPSRVAISLTPFKKLTANGLVSEWVDGFWCSGDNLDQ